MSQMLQTRAALQRAELLKVASAMMWFNNRLCLRRARAAELFTRRSMRQNFATDGRHGNPT